MKYTEYLQQQKSNRKRNNQSGSRNEAERALRWVHERFSRSGQGFIHKTSPPATVKAARGGQGSIRLERANFVDYIGGVRRGDLMQLLVMEAKSIHGGPSWYMSLLKAHQRAFLINHAQMGAVSCLHITRRRKEIKTKTYKHGRWCIPIGRNGKPCRDAFSWDDSKIDFERVTQAGFEVPTHAQWTDAMCKGSLWLWDTYMEQGWEGVKKVMTDSSTPRR